VPAIGDVYEYVFKQLYTGTVMETKIHMRAVVAAPTDAQLKLSAENFLLSLSKVQTTDVQYTQIIIKRVTPIAFDEILYIPTVTINGFMSPPTMNSQLALVVTKRTGVAGTSHRGRMYVGGIPAGAGKNHMTDAGFLTAAGTLAGELLAKFQEGGTDGSVVAGVYSKSIGGTGPMTLAGWQPITRWDPQLIFGVQRKRKEGVGI
jgi:hypothetical protein